MEEVSSINEISFSPTSSRLLHFCIFLFISWETDEETAVYSSFNLNKNRNFSDFPRH